MNCLRLALLLSIALSMGITSKAQKDETKPLATTNAPQASTTPVANPVSSFVKQQLARFNKNMVAAAEAMPAEKYSFKPTPEMNSFAHLTIHIAEGNNTLCSKISGTPAPSGKLTDDDPKDKLVAGLKASFDFCTTALANVDDSKLSEPVVLFGSFSSSRAGALIALSMGFADHYGAQAIYLRLNGILPPTAQPKK
jgi:DinB family protein